MDRRSEGSMRISRMNDLLVNDMVKLVVVMR